MASLLQWHHSYYGIPAADYPAGREGSSLQSIRAMVGGSANIEQIIQERLESLTYSQSAGQSTTNAKHQASKNHLRLSA